MFYWCCLYIFTVGKDYKEVITNITINSTVTSISVPIITDQVVEANEMFQCRITLISPTENGSNVVIAQTEAVTVVVIVDDDSKFTRPDYCGNCTIHLSILLFSSDGPGTVFTV